MLSVRTAKERHKFALDHIGRRTREYYKYHIKAANEAMNASENFARKAEQHEKLGRVDPHIHSQERQ